MKEDAGKAVDLFQKAKLGGDPGSMWRLGMLYEQGKGVPEDKEEAISLCRSAAVLSTQSREMARNGGIWVIW